MTANLRKELITGVSMLEAHIKKAAELKRIGVNIPSLHAELFDALCNIISECLGDGDTDKENKALTWWLYANNERFIRDSKGRVVVQLSTPTAFVDWMIEENLNDGSTI